MGTVEDMVRAYLDAHAETQRRQVKSERQRKHVTVSFPRLDCVYCQQFGTVDYDTLICANCRELCYGARDEWERQHNGRQGYDCPNCGATDTDPDAIDPETGDCVKCRENRSNA